MGTNLNSSDCLSALRALLADRNAKGRWSNETLLSFIDRANKRVVNDVLFPDSRITCSTEQSRQEYPIDFLIIQDYRVYVAGQRVTLYDTDTLEGNQIGAYTSNADPNGLVAAGSGGPPGALGTMNPRWVTQTPLTYPMSGVRTAPPAPTTQPWWIGAWPAFYWRGGSIGLVPAPANETPVTIAIDCVRQPDDVLQIGQPMTSPDNFLDVIVYDAFKQACMSSDSSHAERQFMLVDGMYKEGVSRLITWRGHFPGERAEQPRVLTQRSLEGMPRMSRSRNRGGRW